MASCDDMGQCECETRTSYGNAPILNKGTVCGTGKVGYPVEDCESDRLNPVQESLKNLEKRTYVLEEMIDHLRNRLSVVMIPDYPCTASDCEKQPPPPPKSILQELVEEREHHVRNLIDQVRNMIDRLDV